MALVMLSLSVELEHRVLRGHQTVARQREFVARFGELPIAAALLKTFEAHLAS